MISVDEVIEIVEAAVRRVLDANEPREPSEWLGTAGAAELLDVHRRTVGKLAKSGELPSSRIGKQLRFRRCDLIALLESRSG